MNPALVSFEVIMPEDMLACFPSFRNKILPLNSIMCLLVLWICWRRCLSLILTGALQVLRNGVFCSAFDDHDFSCQDKKIAQYEKL